MFSRKATRLSSGGGETDLDRLKFVVAEPTRFSSLITFALVGGANEAADVCRNSNGLS